MAEFTPQIVEALNQELTSDRVKTRKGQGGMSLSYVEGYDIIDTANRIFGYDGWSTGVDSVAFLQNMGQNGGYLATVWVEAGRSRRGDSGVGLVQGRDGGSAESHEVAIKGAVTDAMKRAFRTFGNQFGNSLYDKESPLHTGGQTAPEIRPTRPAGANGPTPQRDQVAPSMRAGSGFDASDARHASDKQVGFIQSVAKQSGVSPADLEAGTVAMFGYGLDRIGRGDASKLIDALKGGTFTATGANQPPAESDDGGLPF